MIKRIVALAITAVLVFTVLISGASGYSDCAAICMREMAKAHPHTPTGSARLRVPDCCSGSMQSPCEMKTAPAVKIPECLISNHSSLSTHLTAIGMIAGVADADLTRSLKVNVRTIVGESYKDPPIYLQTLSLLY